MVTILNLSSRDIRGLCERYLAEDLLQDHQRDLLQDHQRDLLQDHQTDPLQDKLEDQLEVQLDHQLENQLSPQAFNHSNVELDQKLKQNKLAFTVLHCKVKPMSAAPAGYLGHHQFLRVEIQRHGRFEHLHFFIKSAPIDVASRMKYLEEFGVFKKEITVYSQVLPRLQKISAPVAPKCYYTDNDLLVFENLAHQDFRMAAGRDGLLNYEHLNCALKTLASMHAASIVTEVRHGKNLSDLFPEAVAENAYPSGVSANHVRIKNFNNANHVLCEIVRELPKYKNNLDYITEQLPRCMRAIFKLSRPSLKYQNFFLHGDLWANNIMFRYGNFGDVPIECRLVDFQLARYAPAMLDVITVLTIPTSRAFRERYLLELLRNYYSFLSEFLRCEQLEIEDFMPKQQFFASLGEFRVGGLIESCLFSHLTALPPSLTTELTASTDGFNNFFDHKRTEICMEAFRTDELYRDRMADMIEDLVDNFVLK